MTETTARPMSDHEQAGKIVKHARRIATVAHAGQKDKAGLPYIDHPRRVATALSRMGCWDVVIAVAWLHDVVEDTPITLGVLGWLGMPQVVLDAVAAITHPKGETNRAYWGRVRENPLALTVKLADIGDNLDSNRLAALDPDTRERLRAKYARALQVLLPSAPGSPSTTPPAGSSPHKPTAVCP